MGADGVLIALFTHGPNVVKYPEWVKKMADKPIVFCCANPVPEIYPYMTKEAGSVHRGDWAR